ncbi:inactive serine protease PAMR1-like isoform X2 [Conger conger]|uniref:inactive serine protease PAMR1-like isoform X2 n=1 Tax=Conger conger TaxID=82655 RepID=UPI002A59B54C|nr:inactive serine protease PAMR1-like isoform X2 [Conger conger]
MLSAGRQLVELSRETLSLPILLLTLLFIAQTPAWPHDYRSWHDNNCPSAEWSIMCRGCCEYDQIRCKCPAQGALVGYAVPCCRNAINECDPCIIHPGCSIFENCKRCNNGTWGVKDDFFIKGKYCTECRPGWSGGDCMTCGGVIHKAHGHIVVESYPTNAHCEWTLHVDPGMTVEIRFMMLSLEKDDSCRSDFVEVRDGDGLHSRVIGRYCGNQRPPPIRSTGNSLHVLFVSDGYNNYDGFFAIFKESSACSSSPCLHDGTCILDSADSYRCACLAGYTGRRCENVPRPRTCVAPEKPAHGDHFLLYGAREIAIAVQYLCYRPYVMRGNSQRTCLPNSTWSGTAPSCVKEKEREDEDMNVVEGKVNMRTNESGGGKETGKPTDTAAGKGVNAVETTDKDKIQVTTAVKVTEKSPDTAVTKTTGKVTDAGGTKTTGKVTDTGGTKTTVKITVPAVGPTVIKDTRTITVGRKDVKITTVSLGSNDTGNAVVTDDAGITLVTVGSDDTEIAAETVGSKDRGDTVETVGSKDRGDTFETVGSKDRGDTFETVGSKDRGDTVETVGSKDRGDTVETVGSKGTGRGADSAGGTETGQGSDRGRDRGTEADNLSIHETERTPCPPPPKLYNGYHQVVVGSGVEPDRAEFFCNHSYALSGSAVRTCQPNGAWGGTQPLCIRACREPKVSELVRQKVLPPQVPYRKTPVHKLYSSMNQGKVLDRTGPAGPLSLPPLAPGFHHLYTHIQYECASPFYHHAGSPRRTCLKTGKWSGRHVSCSPVCGRLPAFEPEKLAETRWPWHAAIYRQAAADQAGAPDKMAAAPDKMAAAPDKMAAAAGGPAKAKAGEAEEGGEEEAWQLVCSGALVNQRSVVVAAHCVTQLGKLLPVAVGNIKVVMGKHYRSDHRDSKNLQHLRVSSVLIHPNFDPLVLDSDLAVLKLLDKARIGEHVLPVCLPARQGGEVLARQAYVVGWSILPEAREQEEQEEEEEETARAGLIELGDVVDCERQYAQQGAALSITDNMLCARQHPYGFSNICPADTGGIALLPPPVSPSSSPSSSPSFSAPVFSGGQEVGGTVWRLLAVVSHGYEQQACGPDRYTVYTRTANFKDWIEANMK